MMPAPSASDSVAGRPGLDLVDDVEALGVGVRLAGEDVLHRLHVLDVDRLVEAVLDG